MTPLHEMIGRRVRIIAGDIIYRGLLIEVSEENAELQAESQWITIPIENINSITEEDPLNPPFPKGEFTIIFIFFLVLSANLIGCSGPLKQTNISANESYRVLDTDNLNREQIGFLTATVSGRNGLAEYRSLVSDIIERDFKEELSGISIIASREILNRINSADLTGEYAEMLEHYDVTDILDKKVLIKIGDILGVRYIAQPRLSSFVERTSTRLSAFGLALISTRETTVKVSLQLWDTKTGNIVWEGSGQATFAVEALRAKPVSFEDVTEAASRSLIKKFPH